MAARQSPLEFEAQYLGVEFLRRNQIGDVHTGFQDVLGTHLLVMADGESSDNRREKVPESLLLGLELRNATA